MTPLAHRPWIAQTRVASPLGPLTLAATSAGLGGAWFDGQRHHPGPLAAPHDPAQRWLQQATLELQAYWQDATRAAFKVPLDPGGTPFQQAVWLLLRGITAGQHRGYGELAAALGRPTAARAVGAAVGRNPLSIIVPCHRVLGAGGALTGYAGGLDRKRELLRREAAGF
jgi:methylated-DNA-[protein]-cysteine S-methyltransferase